MFEQLVLQPLWEVHKCGLIEKQLDKLKEFAKKLSIPPLKSRRIDDAFDEFMRLFLPLTRAAVRAIAKCKSPKETCAEDERLSIFVSPNNHRLWEALRLCDPEAEICVAYVAKLLLCDGKKVAMCRVLSGRLVNGRSFCLNSWLDKFFHAIFILLLKKFYRKIVKNADFIRVFWAADETTY